MRRVATAALAALTGVAGAVVSAEVAVGEQRTLDAWAIAVVVAAYAAVGVLVLLRRPGHRVGLLMVGAAMLWGVGEGLMALSVHGLLHEPGDARAGILVTIGGAARGSGWLALVTVLPLVFPDGHQAGSAPLRRCARRAAAATVGLFLVATVAAPVLEDDRLPAGSRNPIGLPGVFGHAVGVVALLTFAGATASVGLGVATLVQRWRRDGARVRQQVLWFTLAFACPIVVFPLALTNHATAWMFAAASVPVPVAIGVAVLQRRLYDVNLAVNRSLTYGTLWLLIAALYALTVGGVGALLRARGENWLPWAATGIVAVTFAPLRNALQAAANRLTYGRWSRPAEVLAATGRRLADAGDVPALLQSLTDELGEGFGIDYVAITNLAGTTLAVHGQEPGTLEQLPLAAYGVPVGTLRFRAARIRATDRELLSDLARQLGGVVHAAGLLETLRQAQEALVLAREEERKRLRRDLHDGIGPALAAMSLQVDTLRNLLGREPSIETPLLTLRATISSVVGDVRRVVEGLRPPALDELGLPGALTLLSQGVSDVGDVQVEVRVDALGPVPAATEVAAYRIVQEALTNVVRHSQARRATVSVEQRDGHLVVEVRDDGIGDVGAREGGVGLTSMRERAEEIGGRLVLCTDPGRTTVRAELPLPDKPAAPAPVRTTT